MGYKSKTTHGGKTLKEAFGKIEIHKTWWFYEYDSNVERVTPVDEFNNRRIEDCQIFKRRRFSQPDWGAEQPSRTYELNNLVHYTYHHNTSQVTSSSSSVH